MLDTMSSSNRDTRTVILNAAQELITGRGGADVTMADIATRAGVSRQAVYLHFADRAELLVALVRHVDAQRGLEREVQRIVDAPDGISALRRFVALQAKGNPSIWAIARALDAVRRRDEAVETSWQDRLANRLMGCRVIVDRLAADHKLRPGLDRRVAAELLWTITSLHTWEDLVLERHWSPTKYQRFVTDLLTTSLCTPNLTDIAPI